MRIILTTQDSSTSSFSIVTYNYVQKYFSVTVQSLALLLTLRMSEQRDRSKMSSTLSAFGGSEACGARWTLGALLLAPLTAANSSYCAVPAVILLATFITIASEF